jgi:hypothetical protein
LNGWKTKTERYLDTILECEHPILTSLEKTQEPKLFRLPYGKIKYSQAKKSLKKGHRIIM